MKPPKWTQKELYKLHCLRLEHQPPRAADLFLEWQAKQKDNNNRSWTAVQRRAQILKTPRVDGFSIRQWSSYLQIPRGRLERVMQLRYGVATTSKKREVSSEQMQELLKDYPEILYQCNLEPIRNWWGDRFVRGLNIPEHYPGRIRVRNCDTGEIFSSVREASKSAFVDASTLGKAIRHNKPCAGYKWERIC